MLLAIASCLDDSAPRLASALGRDGKQVSVLTPADLSRPGWCVDLDAPDDALFVAGGTRYEAREIEGVVCRLPWLFEQELVSLEPEDRSYAAAEMTAFLKFWLSGLSCPKLNPPTAGSLSGPAWRAEQWAGVAVGVEIPVRGTTRTTRRSLTDAEPPTGTEEPRFSTVTLIGERSLGSEDPREIELARRLATAAEVAMLSVSFCNDEHGQPCYSGVNPWPRLDSAAELDALADFFEAA